MNNWQYSKTVYLKNKHPSQNKVNFPVLSTISLYGEIFTMYYYVKKVVNERYHNDYHFDK